MHTGGGWGGGQKAELREFDVCLVWSYLFTSLNHFNQELVAAAPSTRDWAGILISIVVILSIIGMVAMVVKALPPDPSHALDNDRISIEDIVGGGFRPNRDNATWLEGEFYISYITEDKILRVTTLLRLSMLPCF